MSCKILNISFNRIDINVKYSIVLVADAMMEVQYKCYAYFYGMLIFADLRVLNQIIPLGFD